METAVLFQSLAVAGNGQLIGLAAVTEDRVARILIQRGKQSELIAIAEITVREAMEDPLSALILYAVIVILSVQGQSPDPHFR